MKWISVILLAAATATSVFASMSLTPSRANGKAVSPILGVSIPAGYRQWELGSVAHEAGLDELRSILGNALAPQACRDRTIPFPDGAILAKLAWKHTPSSEFSGAFVPGAATTVQIMVRDSKKYASTGGWGFGRFVDGKPVDEAQHKTCIPFHQANVNGHDLVFTRFAR